MDGAKLTQPQAQTVPKGCQGLGASSDRWTKGSCVCCPPRPDSCLESARVLRFRKQKTPPAVPSPPCVPALLGPFPPGSAIYYPRSPWAVESITESLSVLDGLTTSSMEKAKWSSGLQVLQAQLSLEATSVNGPQNLPRSGLFLSLFPSVVTLTAERFLMGCPGPRGGLT